MRVLAVFAATLTLALAACGAPAPQGAAEGVREFFVAVQDGDQAAFEARIDRPALREDLKVQLRRSAEGEGLLGRLLDGGAADGLIDSMITPESFKLAAKYGGAPLTRTPSTAEVAAMLRMNGPDEACLLNRGEASCLMTFRRQDGVWKLVGLKSGQVQVRAGDSAAG